MMTDRITLIQVIIYLIFNNMVTVFKNHLFKQFTISQPFFMDFAFSVLELVKRKGIYIEHFRQAHFHPKYNGC